MAISPRSRGLGNIGNIVNRQGLIAPTRPQPQIVQIPQVVPPMVQRPMPVSSPMTQPAKLNPMLEWARNHPTNTMAPGLPDGQTTPPTGTIPQDFYDPFTGQQGLDQMFNQPTNGFDFMNQNQDQLKAMFGDNATQNNFGMSGTVGNTIAPNMYNLDPLQQAFNPNGTDNNNSGSLFGGGGFANY